MILLMATTAVAEVVEVVGGWPAGVNAVSRQTQISRLTCV